MAEEEVVHGEADVPFGPFIAKLREVVSIRYWSLLILTKRTVWEYDSVHA